MSFFRRPKNKAVYISALSSMLETKCIGDNYKMLVTV